MFGWARGSKETAEYTRKADPVRLALQGSAKLEDDNKSRTSIPAL